MALVTGVTLPNNGDRIKAENYNSPITKILAQLNGNLDSANIISLPGSKLTANSIPITAMDSTVAAGWYPSADALTYSANNGNKEYAVTISGDKTSTYSKGMRVKLNRSTTPPTQCTDLESSSSQYASRASGSLANITFTDDYTIEAWIKLESYSGSDQVILSRWDGSNGWRLALNTSGQIFIQGVGPSANRTWVSYQSVPLGVWVHVAASLDMSGATGATYINGVAVSSAAGGTTGSALSQGAGPLQIGAFNALNPFDGKLADVRLWNTVRTTSQIRENMNQQLTGSETNLIGYWKLNGDFNDSTSNANNLTGQNSATATNADNPMNSTEYGIITKVAYSAPNTTLTIFTGTDYNIPNGTLSSFHYSTHRAPYGFPASKYKWGVFYKFKVQISQSVTSISAWLNHSGLSFQIPTGEFDVQATFMAQATASTIGFVGSQWTVSSTNNTQSDDELSGTSPSAAVNQGEMDGEVKIEGQMTNAASATWYLNTRPTTVNGTTTNYILGTTKPAMFRFFCAYL